MSYELALQQMRIIFPWMREFSQHSPRVPDLQRDIDVVTKQTAN
jgi:hypothetical protein